MLSNLFRNCNKDLKKFLTVKTAFSRRRKLTISHVIGQILHTAANQNGTGYAISSQNYGHELKSALLSRFKPVAASTFCEARRKVSYEALEHLLKKANSENTGQLRWKKHNVRAIDSTKLTLPNSRELNEAFSFPKGGGGAIGYYPQGVLITAKNILTGQPTAARLVQHMGSKEKEAVLDFAKSFNAGDVCVLDRGFHDMKFWNELTKMELHYVVRYKVGRGDSEEIARLRKSVRRSLIVTRQIKDGAGNTVNIKFRVIRGRRDKEGNLLFVATNLLDEKTYSNKSILKLYNDRWTVETLFDRLKNLSKLENFRARNINGIMQEIFAHLLLLSMTALLAMKTSVDDQVFPVFKAVLHILKRHLPWILHSKQSKNLARLLRRMWKDSQLLRYKKRPNRSYPRVSKQPSGKWNFAKADKLKKFMQKNAS
ncbi:MAG: IS4 family transposase [Pseudobdellovibrionaceae bacterium]